MSQAPATSSTERRTDEHLRPLRHLKPSQAPRISQSTTSTAPRQNMNTFSNISKREHDRPGVEKTKTLASNCARSRPVRRNARARQTQATSAAGPRRADHEVEGFEVIELTRRLGSKAGGEAPGAMRGGRRGGDAVEMQQEGTLGT
jgi:hypothetical protein